MSENIISKTRNWAKENKWMFNKVTKLDGSCNVLKLTNNNNENIVLILDVREAKKIVGIGVRYSELTAEELQFIDNLGFELSDDHTNATGQEVTDWF